MEQTAVRLSRRVNGGRDWVFQLLTEPEWLVRWIGPSQWSPFADVELGVGRKYRLGMRLPNGETITATGTYLEITPPERLVFTWGWLGEDYPPSRVTFELQGRGSETEIQFTHEGFVTAEQVENHHRGWNDWFDRLESLAQNNPA